MASHDREPGADDRAQLEHDIQVKRARLGHTVEELSQRLDVERQARRHQQQLVVGGAAVAVVVALVLVWRRTR